MMTRHAPSQINDTEAVRFILSALRSPDHVGTLELVEGRQISRSEMVARWLVETPEGPLSRVAVIRVIDGEPIGFDAFYTDEADARAVYAHLVEEAA